MFPLSPCLMLKPFISKSSSFPKTRVFESEISVCLKVYIISVLVTQSCLTFCDPIDCSLSGLSVHGILQGRMLEWVAKP